MTRLRYRPQPLDCGHPDPTPDTSHTTHDGHTVCPHCCDICQEQETS